jgi:hypothetical protein
MHNINVPALSAYGGAGPDTELIVAVTWTCNSSAGNKSIACSIGNVGGSVTSNVYSDTQTTNVTNEWFFKISCRGSTKSPLCSATPSLTSNSSTAVKVLTNMDMTQSISIVFFGSVAVGTDSLQIQRYTVYLSNGPTQKFQRFGYGKKWFWGMNTHWDEFTTGGGPTTPAQGITNYTTLGATVMRITNEGGTSMNSITAVAQALVGTAIKMYCCIDIGIPLFAGAKESDAYADGYQAGRSTALALAPYGVTVYECGNEMDTKAGINVAGDNGAFPSSFSNTLWPLFRGEIAGCIDGVHSVPGCYAASNAFTICGIGAMDMLYFGTAPDGSSGYKQLRWDISAFHNYRPYGPLTAVQTYSGGGWVNIYEYLQRTYGAPIYISEFNDQVGDTDAQIALWNTRVMTEMYANRYKYNIMGCNIYEMLGGNPWGMFDSPGVPNNPRGTTVQAFIAANPDTGL